MPSLSFEVGAIFIIEDRATAALAQIGRAFESLGELAASVEEKLMGIGEGAFAPMLLGIERASSATKLMIDQIGAVADAWGRAATAAQRYGTAAGSGAAGAGSGGGRGGPRDEGLYGPPVRDRYEGYNEALRDNQRYDREQRMNADALNRNEDQIYSRQEAAARREKAARDLALNDGPIGPVSRPYWGQGEEWANAAEENRRWRQSDDGLSIPPPPRTGITDFTRAREPLGPREQFDFTDADKGAAVGAAAARRGGHGAGMGFRGEVGSHGFRGGGVIHGLGPFIALGAVYGGGKSAMQEDRALAQALQEMGYDPREPGFQLKMDEMRGKVAEATAGTIYSEAHGASVLPGTAGQFSGLFNTPQERRTAYQAVLPPALKFAEVAEQYHRGTIGESYKAGIGYLAMTNQTTEKGAETGLSQLLALSLATGDTIAQEQNVLKYSLPVGKAAGADPVETAALTGFMEILGFRGTTAGTGVGQMIMGLTGTGGPLAAQQRREKDMGREFSNILHLNPREMHAVKESRGKEHDIALKSLDLLDPKTGKISDQIAPGGHLAIQPFIEHVSGALQRMTPMQGLDSLRNAFTVRGSREAAELKDTETIKRLLDFFGTMKAAPSVDDLQKQLATRPLQQFEQMLANVANIGNTLATATLGPLNTAFMTLNGYLAGFNTFLKTHQGVTEAAGWTGLAMGGAAALGVAGSGVRALWRYSGARAVASGVSSLLGGGAAPVIGEEALAGIGGGSLLGPMGLLGGGLLAAGGAAGAMNAPMVDDFGRPVGTWGGRPSTTAMAAPSNTQVTVNLGPVTMHGVPDDSSLRGIIDTLTKGLRDTLSHMTSDATGSSMSPYTQPGPF